MEEFKDLFPRGDKNDAYSKYFVGQSYLKMLSSMVVAANVTFEPGCRNNWHIHNADEGGGQVLLVTAGEGWYQEWGKKSVSLKPGSFVDIPAGVKHWHGAKKDSWFSHIAIEVPAKNGSTKWCEEVSDEEYSRLEEEK